MQQQMHSHVRLTPHPIRAMSSQNKKGTAHTTQLCHLPRFEQHPCKILAKKAYTCKNFVNTPQQDAEYEALKAAILQGFPNTKTDLPMPLRKFWSTKDHLSIDENLITYGCRLFIPTSLRPTLLSGLHEAHQGISRSQAGARLTIYWPGIDQDIEHFVQTADTVKTIFRHTAKNQWYPSLHLRDHSST